MWLQGASRLLDSSRYTIARSCLMAAALFWCLPMLLTSPGDGSSSVPIDSLQPRSTDSSLSGQTSMAGDRGLASFLETRIEDYHAPLPSQDPLAFITARLSTDTSAPTLGVPTMQEPSSNRQPPLQQTAWSTMPSQEHDLAGLYALRQAAALKALQPPRTRSWNRRSLTALTGVPAPNAVDMVSFAAPLSPLRERDLTALSEFFLRDDMPAIEADINQRLLLLLPEPCWEDEVFDFLKEFL